MRIREGRRASGKGTTRPESGVEPLSALGEVAIDEVFDPLLELDLDLVGMLLRYPTIGDSFVDRVLCSRHEGLNQSADGLSPPAQCACSHERRMGVLATS